jgi:hypothetical protein
MAWVEIVLAIIGSGACFTFIQFLISRHDEKKGKHKRIMDAISAIKKEIDEIKKGIERDRAENARIRILNFSDEIRHYVVHSKESFDQVNVDIDTYRNYCNKHSDYKNNKAAMAIANIEKVYEDNLQNNSFLE